MPITTNYNSAVMRFYGIMSVSVKEIYMAKKKLKNILFVTTEAVPFASTGGMGEVCGNLPRALNRTKQAAAREIGRAHV